MSTIHEESHFLSKTFDTNKKSIALKAVLGIGTSSSHEAEPFSWAARLEKSLSPDEKVQMNELHTQTLQAAAEERRKKKEADVLNRIEQKRLWEIRCQKRIERKYGSFWYFIVESTVDDSDAAKQMREDGFNQQSFRSYLYEKYFRNWLSMSENTCDDCTMLQLWRHEDELRMREYEEDEERRALEYSKQEEKIKNDMLKKLECGEISQAEYNEWQWQKECDDECAFQAEGDAWYNSIQQHNKEHAEWKKRKGMTS
jgi:hypothetical protein